MISPRKAFTLIELLVVMAVIGIVSAFVVPALTGILGGSQISTGVETVFGAFSNARQLAASKNEGIEIRLIEMKDPAFPASTSQIRAVQLLEIRDDGPHQIGNVRLLPAGVIIGAPVEMTSLSALTNTTASSGDPSLPRVDRNYKYRSFSFHPDGSLNLNQKAELSGVTKYFLTLYGERFKPAGSTPPTNFATIQLEPSTGAAVLYRP